MNESITNSMESTKMMIEFVQSVPELLTDKSRLVNSAAALKVEAERILKVLEKEKVTWDFSDSELSDNFHQVDVTGYDGYGNMWHGSYDAGIKTPSSEDVINIERG